MAQNQVANVLENNTPKLYCDYCDMYLTHDSPSVRKTHNIDRKHKENVKKSLPEMHGRAGPGITTAAFQQGKVSPPLFSSPSLAGAMIQPLPTLLGPTYPGVMTAPHIVGRSSHDDSDGPSS